MCLYGTHKGVFTHTLAHTHALTTHTHTQLPGCDGSMLLIFNPLTFDPQDLEQHCIPSVLQAVLLPMFDSTHSRILVTVSNNMQVVCVCVWLL